MVIVVIISSLVILILLPFLGFNLVKKTYRVVQMMTVVAFIVYYFVTVCY